MFLSDVSENVALFRKKRYEEYLRENQPELSAEIEKKRKYIASKMKTYKDGTKQKENAYKPFRKKLREKIDVLQPEKSLNGVGYGLRDLKRFEPLPNLKNTLPELGSLRRKDEAFNVLAGKHDVTGVVNPVKDTFTATSVRKPITQVITPKPAKPKPNGKDTKKLLKTLGFAGVVSGGLLGAYSLKKYNDKRKKENV